MKPHVICLMASSVDGRTLHSRWRPKGSGGDLFEQAHDELAGDAWLVGRVTGQEFAKGKPYPASTKESFPRQPWFVRRDAKAYGVVLDAHGKIGWGRSDPAWPDHIQITSSSSARFGFRPADHFECFCRRRDGASRQTARGPLARGPTYYRPQSLRCSGMDRR
jgi:hypothetical protein